MQQLSLYWSPVGQKNGKCSDHLRELPSENKSSVNLGIFRTLWLEIHSYLTKASCLSLILMQQLFLYWSPVDQKNWKYSDHLRELPCENKCSVPLEYFRMLWLEIHSYLTKASCFSLLLMQELFLYWSPVAEKNEKYSDHLSEPPYENKCLVPLEYFRMLWLEIHSYLTKASCFSLLLMQEIFLYWSPIAEKNEKYSDHLSGPPYENKCSVPPGKF